MTVITQRTVALLPLLGCLLLLPPAKLAVAEPGAISKEILGRNQIRFEPRSTGGFQAVCYCGIVADRTQISNHAKRAVLAAFDPTFLASADRLHSNDKPLPDRRPVQIARPPPSAISLRVADFIFSPPKPSDEANRKLATDLERALSSEEILELFLNRAVFGRVNGRPVVGIEQAARLLFGETARNITLYEAAALVGLLKRKGQSNAALRRGDHSDVARPILELMAQRGFISNEELEPTARERGRTSSRDMIRVDSGYFIAEAERELRSIGRTGTGLRNVRVFVALDLIAQFWAQQAVELGIMQVDPEQQAEGALVSLDYDGRVLAMVGGRNFRVTAFNRATQAKRQPASAFKIFVYLAALEAGYTTNSTVIDVRIPNQDWGRNDADVYRGTMRLADALAHSANSVAIRLAHHVGITAVAEMAERLGIRSHLKAVQSLALGTSEVSLVELTGAYVAIANGGFRVRPHTIVAMTDQVGRVLWHEATRSEQPVIESAVAAGMNTMLRAVVSEGTGVLANVASDAAGKTGTGQESRDAWFIGYTQGRVTGLWVGRDDFQPVLGSTGHAVARAWGAFNANLQRYSPR